MASSSLNIPSGYKFVPTDTEIVIHYLKRKILDQQLPADIIPTADVYSKNPDQFLLRKFKYGRDNEWYFFSTRRKNNLYTSDGYWHSILNENVLDGDKLVGFMDMLTFYEGKPLQGTKTNWFIQEYRVNPEIFAVNELDDTIRKKISELVICKIFLMEDDGVEDDPGENQSNVKGSLQ